MAEATRFETTKPSADRILIVEDEENARLGYEALLRRWGYEVLGVSNAEEALAKFSEFAPAVLIADVELPGMNGLDLLARLGEDLQNVPAIVITGKGRARCCMYCWTGRSDVFGTASKLRRSRGNCANPGSWAIW
jgi:CheY-like chemotaxis protein